MAFYFWSSSSYHPTTWDAFAVYFYDGIVGPKPKDGLCKVRAVRNGP
jgi:hypothetical protein